LRHRDCFTLIAFSPVKQKWCRIRVSSKQPTLV
jgi:hypothetical protein